MVTLKDSVRYKVKEGNILLIGSDEIYEITNISEGVISFIDNLQSGLCESDYLKLQNKYSEIDKFLIQEQFLIHTDYIQRNKNSLHDRTYHYLEEYRLLPESKSKQLKEKIVVIIGCGGVGSVVFEHLLRNEIRNFILIDSAKVDLPDLNRQYIFRKDSVGEEKTKVLTQMAYKLYPDVNIQISNSYVSVPQDLDFLLGLPIDIIVNAIDGPTNGIRSIEDFSIINAIPYIEAGVGVRNGSVGPLLIPGKTCCPKCFNAKLKNDMSQEESEIRLLFEEPIRASFGPTNFIISSYVSHMIWHYLAGSEIKNSGKQFYFNFDNLSISHCEEVMSCSCWGGENE